MMTYNRALWQMGDISGMLVSLPHTIEISQMIEAEAESVCHL